MNRRRFLRGAGAAGVASLSGCLERLGFEEESAWRDPPLVEDRPEAVYVPASTETMGSYGGATDGEYAVALTYTIPHRFWTVTDVGTSRVTVGTDDTLHLMCTVWDPETDLVLPVDMEVELRRDGETVADFVPWAMLSQRMGFHYGDNVVLPEEGAYTARILVGPVGARRTGALEGRFEEATTLEVDFEFARSDVHDVEFEPVDRDRRGERDALALMDHGHGGGDSGGSGHGGDGSDGDDSRDPGPPSSRGPPVDELPGRYLGTGRSADARLSALATDEDRLSDGDGTYLAVFPRTPYNRVVLPFTSLSATVTRDGEEVFAGALRESIDHELGHHYGATVEDVLAGDLVTISVDSRPLVARHDGYETAFFEFDDVEFPVG